MESKIYGSYFFGLGDCWASLSNAILTSRKIRSPVLFSMHVGNPLRKGPTFIGDKLKTIYSLLDTTGADVRFTDERMNTPKFCVGTSFDPYVRTKLQWDGGSSGAVCYQLETPARMCHVDRNIAPSDLKQLYLWLRNRPSHNLYPMDMPIYEKVEKLSRCLFFIGICSGMSHVCHSIGVPTYIKSFNCNGVDRLPYAHAMKGYAIFLNLKDLVDMLASHQRSV